VQRRVRQQHANQERGQHVADAQAQKQAEHRLPGAQDFQHSQQERSRDQQDQGQDHAGAAGEAGVADADERGHAADPRERCFQRRGAVVRGQGLQPTREDEAHREVHAVDQRRDHSGGPAERQQAQQEEARGEQHGLRAALIAQHAEERHHGRQDDER